MIDSLRRRGQAVHKRWWAWPTASYGVAGVVEQFGNIARRGRAAELKPRRGVAKDAASYLSPSNRKGAFGGHFFRGPVSSRLL